MQLTPMLASLILTAFALAAPATEVVQKRSGNLPICGKVGIVGNGVQGSYTSTGQYSTIAQCAETIQYAGYKSFSYHHPTQSCTYYNEPVSNLAVTLVGGDGQVFFNEGCGDYNPQCGGIEISTNHDYSLVWGQEYSLGLTSGHQNLTEAYNMCNDNPVCFSVAFTFEPNVYLLLAATSEYLNQNTPQSDETSVFAYDIACWSPENGFGGRTIA